MKDRKIPLRKCIITNERFPKEELIRVVKDNTGKVSLDLSGKLNGRGAYLKKDIKVIRKAIKSNKLNRHLGVTIPEEIYEELLGMFDE